MTRRDFLPALLGGTGQQTVQTDAQRLMTLRKHFGDDKVLDALVDGGSVKDARRILNRDRQREERAATREERRNERGRQQRIYRGPVTLSPEIRSIIDGGRLVKAAMHGRRIVRATAPAVALDGVGFGGQGVVVIVDGRNDALDGQPLMAELIDTGRGHRLHLYRPKMMSAKPPVLVGIPAPIQPPLEAPKPSWSGAMPHA